MKNACQYCMEEFPKKEGLIEHEKICKWQERPLTKIWIIRKLTCKVVEKKAYITVEPDGVLSANTVNGTTYVGKGVEFFTEYSEAQISAAGHKADLVKELTMQIGEVTVQMAELERQMQKLQARRAKLS